MKTDAIISFYNFDRLNLRKFQNPILTKILPPAPIVVHKEIDVANESSPSSTIGDPLIVKENVYLVL